jgi:hypothetical protein
MHEVCLTTGVSQCQIGEDINNLLIRKKVDLVLQGHDHAYFRSKQLAINSTTCPNVPSDSYNSTTTKVGSANLNCVVNDGSTGSYVKGAGTVLWSMAWEERPISPRMDRFIPGAAIMPTSRPGWALDTSNGMAS